MEEKRKKFGMEILPSLHKRVKQLAVARGVPLWVLTQGAFQRYLELEDQRISGITGLPSDIETGLESRDVRSKQAQAKLPERVPHRATDDNLSTIDSRLRSLEDAISELRKGNPLTEARLREVGSPGK